MVAGVIESARPRVVVLSGLFAAVCCVGFAVVNVAFESSGRFADGPLADYAAGLTVMNWLVVLLKLLGAAVAVYSLTANPKHVEVLGVLLWGAFSLLALYALGSVAEAAAILSGLTGNRDAITLASVAYVAFFTFLAVAFGILAVAHTRRFGLGPRCILLGALGAPLVLAVLLVGVPALLVGLGLMPSF
ncbi:hypothetical protein [Kribbella shirazensis]|uniref:Uncharacterized protein n=1 Tax=Kribbella shirazensis TaxID=1105143 RepID=A0A7X6A1T0_9ACTN|nr:hypothetical protein [Kribbella shirazensis]NIK58551.1 hypothetical protein [Kribbella shirazensis]